ncbi:hypothetical protein AURDEDRAFT_114891 [Auricularia subglabra TFB-10046 SS5]|nr:hypothetical protein AURDEDRAFT_114891 [Auricularia subglabra TFB-10046 SS5]
MHAIQPLTRVASNTVLGKRRALADDDLGVAYPDSKRAKGCSVLCEEWDAAANKENIPPFARGPSAPRRPTTLSRRASTGPGAGAARRVADHVHRVASCRVAASSRRASVPSARCPSRLAI